jgi:L-lactate dehydrogenase complex protein LldG
VSERENILGRIREALVRPAPRPGHHSSGSPAGASTANARAWLPGVGDTFDQRLTLFRQNAALLKAEFYVLNDLEQLAGSLTSLRDAERWQRVGLHRGELTDLACAQLGLPVCRTDKPFSIRDLEACDAGITECDALVAQTGSILITSRSAGGRALSVLPPHHVVLARRHQLLADLPEAFAVLKRTYGSNYPSFISFITGPSRTGDIERILVLGAHGPKKLTIFCV